jgi:two-component system, response regulator PdtaR
MLWPRKSAISWNPERLQEHAWRWARWSGPCSGGLRHGSDALEDAGYEVLEAASADEALRLLDANDDVRLLFTDIRMPGEVDGLQLADLVQERWPTVKILITSGNTWPPHDRIPHDGRFIAKPYKVSALCNQVDEIIGE